MKAAKTESMKHRRKILVELCLPVTVELVVGTDDDPTEDADWQVLEVCRANCDATPRDVHEHSTEDDFESIAVSATNSKDVV